MELKEKEANLSKENKNNIEIIENEKIKEGTDISKYNKMKPIKLVNRISTKYKTIRIIPGLENEEIGTYFIAKSLTELNNFNKYLKKRDSSLFQIKEEEKAVYIIDLSNNNVYFYFILPEDFEIILRERINEVYKNCKIEDIDNLNVLNLPEEDIIVNSLSYKYNNTYSLNCECNSDLNDLITNSQWLQDDDRIIILYNLFPSNKKEFTREKEECFRKIKEHKEIDLIKNKLSGDYISAKLKDLSIYLADGMFDLLDGLVNGYNDKIKKYSNQEKVNVEEHISSFTRAKIYAEKLNSQIAIVSYSKDDKRRRFNLRSISSSYSVFENDNTLISSKTTMPNILDSKWKMPINIMSINEVAQFVTFPNRYVLEESNNVEHINVKQSQSKDYLTKGVFYLGVNDYKGICKDIYAPRDYDSESLPHVFVSPQGSGKTSLMTNLSINASSANQGTVVLDYIKNCEYANNVIKHTNKSKLVILDVEDIKSLPLLDFNEYKILPNSTEEEIGKIIDKKKMATEKIIETLNEKQPLTASMSRILTSACDIVYSFENTSFNDVIEVISNFKVREQFINKAESIFFTDRVLNKRIEEALLTLESINEYENSKDKNGNKCKVLTGTKETKINGLLDRISKLNKSYILSHMLYGTTKEIDFAKLLDEGKTIVVKMQQHTVSDYEKNVIATFITIKTILATLIRGKQNQPRRSNLFIDEVYQVPTVENVIYAQLNQLRKYGLKVILSVHRLTQLNNKEFQNELLSSGASFSLLAGCKEVQFRDFQAYVGDFTLEDVINMKPFHALHIIHTNKNGDWIGVTKLPKLVD